ncbi:GntR family transcriptional regulator [Labrys neptuniae]|uniref:GntR family transcriptional regulator n=1 Tax=Labrys neptuniae TaxID=376174 RepID=UPI002891ACAA|nr:GntR family transcriptional regulator [Labrys neptuniae]MDT3377392.1 GntR family transcriptional regulator [Labrys neptuniae]
MNNWTAVPHAPMANGVVGGKRRTSVYSTLRTHALHYRFKPGQHLPISVIAQLLGVSNTPVREALMRLHAEGLVDAVPAKGFFAREIRLQDMVEFNGMLCVVVRHCLEGGGLDLCLAPQREADGAALPLQLKTRGTPSSLARETEMLFEALGRATGEKTIPICIHRLCEQTHHIRLRAFESRRIGSRLRHALAELVAALRRRDREVAIDRLVAFSQLFAQALPHLVSHALAAAYAAELTDLANWVTRQEEAA